MALSLLAMLVLLMLVMDLGKNISGVFYNETDMIHIHRHVNDFDSHLFCISYG